MTNIEFCSNNEFNKKNDISETAFVLTEEEVGSICIEIAKIESFAVIIVILKSSAILADHCFGVRMMMMKMMNAFINNNHNNNNNNKFNINISLLLFRYFHFNFFFFKKNEWSLLIDDGNDD